MKVGEMKTNAGCRVMIERAGEAGVGVSVTQPDGKKSETYALNTEDLKSVIALFETALSTSGK
jgi:hypothetical protein